MMFAAALFLESQASKLTAVLVNVQFTTSIASLVCGVVFLGMLALVRYGFDISCAPRMLVFAYGLTLICYETLMLFWCPEVLPQSCGDYVDGFGSYWVSFSWIGLLTSWFQNEALFLVIALQVLAVHAKAHSRDPALAEAPPRLARALVAACCLGAVVP